MAEDGKLEDCKISGVLIDWPPICSSPSSVLAMKELLGGFYYIHTMHQMSVSLPVQWREKIRRR